MQVSKSIHEDNFFFKFQSTVYVGRDACKQNNSQLLSLLFTFFVYQEEQQGEKEEGEKDKKQIVIFFLFVGNSFLYLSSLWKSSFDDQELGILQYLNTVNICYVQMKAQITYKHRMSIAFFE